MPTPTPSATPAPTITPPPATPSSTVAPTFTPAPAATPLPTLASTIAPPPTATPLPTAAPKSTPVATVASAIPTPALIPSPTPAPLPAGTVAIGITDANTGLPDATGPAGGQATVRVSAAPANNLAGVQFKVGFDSTVVQVADGGVTPAILLQGFLFNSRVDNSQGSVTVVVAGANTTNLGSVAIADITFDLIGNAGQSTPITLSDALASDASAQPIPVVPINGSLTLVAPTTTLVAPTTAATGGQPSTPASTAVPTLTGTQSTSQPGQSGGSCNPLAPGTGFSIAGLGDLSLLALGMLGLCVYRRRRSLR